MRSNQLVMALSMLEPNKRIKFQNRSGWGDETIAPNAIIEQGNVYILIWACHPKIIKDDLLEGQRLVWYNPNTHGHDLVNRYFPYYVKLF